MLRFPPRRILVSVEFSKESLYAWQAAKEISERFGSSLEAVWCIEPLPTEILRAERSRDMVVLVAHRKSLLGDMVLGTTIERVLRHSRLPVLALLAVVGGGSERPSMVLEPRHQ